MSDASMTLANETLSIDNIRFSSCSTELELDELLSKYHSKKVKVCNVKRKPINLHEDSRLYERSTILIEILVSNEVFGIPLAFELSKKKSV